MIFVLGAMIRSWVNNNFLQNEYLRAMRMAFAKSFESSMHQVTDSSGKVIDKSGDMSRATASLLFIEDRTTPDANKYGAQTRTPYSLSVNATFSKNLFKQIDFGEVWNIPVQDVFVNGQHFTFTTAGFELYDVSSDPGSDGPGGVPRWSPLDCGSKLPGIPCQRFFKIVPNGGAALNPNDPNTTDPGFCSVDPCQCATGGCQTTCVNNQTICNTSCASSPDINGCLLACKVSFDSCVNSIPDYQLTAVQRFDLDWNVGTPPVDPAFRTNFAWQWNAVYANTIDIDLDSGKNNSIDVDGDRKEEQILEMEDNLGRRYTTHDAAEGKNKDKPKAVINKVWVIDQQKGDLDVSEPPANPFNPPGLKENMQMFTYTQNGTYLQILEGKLYNPETNTTVRSVQKKDQVDIIWRFIQLSNDTGRLCGNGTPAWWDVPNHEPNTDQNPAVEACNNCTSSIPDADGIPNIQQTCFDETTFMLYVRSQVHDRRGHKWITDVSGP